MSDRPFLRTVPALGELLEVPALREAPGKTEEMDER